jgi:hypothetical protein
LGDFVLYAQRSIAIGIHTTVTGGDLGVEYPAPSNGQAQLMVGDFDQTDSTHSLLSPSVSLGPHAQVGDVQTNGLQNNGANALGKVAPFPGPAMPAGPLATYPSGGGQDTTVAAHQTLTLQAGTYGNLTLADHSSVTLGPGSYTFGNVNLGEHCSVTGDPHGVSVVVGGSFNVASQTTVTPGEYATADKLSIIVASSDGPGTPTPVPAAAVASHAQVTALVAVPLGTLSLADHVQAVGAFAAFDISVADHTTVSYQSGFSAATQGIQQLGGYLTMGILTAPILGPAPPSLMLPMGIGLPERNAAQLQTLIRQVSDPASSTYRQYVSTSTFADNYGATSTDYGSLTAWAQSAFSATNSYPNNLFLDFVGTVGQVEQALHVNILFGLRPDGTRFYAIDRQPSVALQPTVLGIDGTDTYFRPVGAAGSGAGGCGTGPYIPADIRAAYVGGCLDLDGSGQSIGILGFTPFDPSEYGTYETRTGITTLVPTPPPVTIIPVNGGLDNALDAGADAQPLDNEPNLDIEMAAAIAPQAKVYVFSGPDIASILQTMATRRDINQFSSSYVYTMSCPQLAVAQTAADQMAAFGQSLYQSSGDDGAYDPKANGTCAFTEEPVPGVLPTLPGSMPGNRVLQDLTIVGGTQLSTTGPAGSWSSEVAWESSNATTCDGGNCVGSGGGILSAPFCNFPSGAPIPWYQAPINGANGASTTNRNVPDVAMLASNVYAVFTSTPPTGPDAGAATPIPGQDACGAAGTSAATPLWAGFTALMNQQAQDVLGQQPVGFAAPALYTLYGMGPSTYNGAFHDIQSGTNANGCFAGYDAGSGYDLVTGLGSPSCGLISQVGALASPPELQVTLTNVLYGTTGSNFGNCGQPVGGANTHIQNGMFVLDCTPTIVNGVVSASPVTYTEQMGCGDGHAALLTISCFGSGQSGDPSLSGSVTMALSSTFRGLPLCPPLPSGTMVSRSDYDDDNDDRTWSFSGVLRGAPQQFSLDSCDEFSNVCAGDGCNFNTFSADILAASIGGF